MKFIIDSDLVRKVSSALKGYIETIDTDCARSGCECDLRCEPASQYISDVLHDFESGLCVYISKEEEKKGEKNDRKNDG